MEGRGGAFLKLHCIMGSGDKKRIRGAYVTLLSDATAFNHSDLSLHMSKTTGKMTRCFWWWNTDTFIVCCWGFWAKIISIRRGFASTQRCIFTLVGFPARMRAPCIQINNQRKGGEGEKGEEAKREDGGKKMRPEETRRDEKPLMIKSSAIQSSFNPHLNFTCTKTEKKKKRAESLFEAQRHKTFD